MRIEDIRLFVTVARLKNFTIAANENFITQSALSRSITRIENEIGQKLLIRNTHFVELTEAGELTLKMGMEMLRQYNSYLEHMEKIKAGQTGALRLAEIYYAMDRYLSKTLGEFKRIYPDVATEIMPKEPQEVLKAVQNRDADLGFTISYFQPSPNNEFQYVHIATEKIYMIFPESHPLSTREEIQLEDLDNEVLLCLSNEKTTFEYISSLMKERSIFPKRIHLCNRASYYSAEILAENAFTFIPECMREHPHRGLAIRPLTEEIYAHYYYLYRKDNVNPAVKLYINLL